MKVADYLKSRGVAGGWKLEGCCEDSFDGAVVIPALAESANLTATLSSLSCCQPDELGRFLIVVVVNHRVDACLEDKDDNRATLTSLETLARQFAQLKLAWVDAASPGRELPIKGGGVGMARKIGCDLALSRLNLFKDPLLVCLDADTVVRPDYLAALERHFRNSRSGAAVIPFLHMPGDTPQGEKAIERYELFLRSYVYGLELAGSPYAFHTVGSAMACRVSAYLKIGGMNCRQAGEDFYFLQQLARVVGVAQLSGTIVYPSARSSHRVPFGTGRAVAQTLKDGEQALLFYRSDCFRILGMWLVLASGAHGRASQDVMDAATRIAPELYDYLQATRFPEVWQKLQRNHPQPERCVKAFHDWFDGLKTMKLIHHLSAETYPRCEPDVALPALFERGGIVLPSKRSGQLETLRRLQLKKDYHTTMK